LTSLASQEGEPCNIPEDDCRPIGMTAQPTPGLMTAVGHALLRSVAAGQGGYLLAATDAVTRLSRLLPDASTEARLVAALLAVTIEPSPQSAVTSPRPSPARRQAKAGKPVKQSRKPKASTPRMDAGGRLIPSKQIGDVAVVSQAQARQALGVSCVQMLKIENQKLLQRIQQGGSRLVFYSAAEVQRLLDLVSGGREPEPSQDGEAMSYAAALPLRRARPRRRRRSAPATKSAAGINAPDSGTAVEEGMIARPLILPVVRLLAKTVELPKASIFKTDVGRAIFIL
jgi:hypothetical protein